MAPMKGSSKGSSKGPSDGGSKGSKTSTVSGGSRVSKSKSNFKRPPPKEMKNKARTEQANLQKKKKRVYTDAELDLPKLNAITPVGVVKPKGKKKGKVFVDDQEGMMTILAMVNAEKEGQIESKMMKARQMEEIREAKKKEAEARLTEKKDRLEAVKNSIRQQKKDAKGDDRKAAPSSAKSSAKGKRKSVSFA